MMAEGDFPKTDGDVLYANEPVEDIFAYLDGSTFDEGDVTIAAGATIYGTHVYSSLTIDPGQTLTLGLSGTYDWGTQIICLGNLTNNGTITSNTVARTEVQRTELTGNENGTWKAGGVSGGIVMIHCYGNVDNNSTIQVNGGNPAASGTSDLNNVDDGGGGGSLFTAGGADGSGGQTGGTAATDKTGLLLGRPLRSGNGGRFGSQNNGAFGEGGGGGGAGGTIILNVRGNLDNTGGTLSSTGGTGGNGDAAAGDDTDGGGGGAGGFIFTSVGGTLTAGTRTVTGGAGGTGNLAGSAGAAGTAGEVVDYAKGFLKRAVMGWNPT